MSGYRSLIARVSAFVLAQLASLRIERLWLSNLYGDDFYLDVPWSYTGKIVGEVLHDAIDGRHLPPAFTCISIARPILRLSYKRSLSRTHVIRHYCSKMQIMQKMQVIYPLDSEFSCSRSLTRSTSWSYVGNCRFISSN